MEILRRNLDAEQRRIAEIAGENLLVLAGPGSGKTRLLTNAAAYRLRLAPSEPWRVCCLTFTVEAARQLRFRIQSPELGAVPSRRIWVGNFHQFAQMLLGSYGHLLGWPRKAGIITPADAKSLLADVVVELGMGNVNLSDVLDAISATKGRRPSPGSVDQRSESFVRLSQAYQDRLREAALRDFDDLLVDAIRLLREQNGVRRVVNNTYRHVFVDELQDSSQIQMDLLGLLVDAATVRIFGVADADQMIYTWRDARPENLEEFEQRFCARIESLGGNYRCPERIVQAATAIIANNPERQRVAQDLRSLVTTTDGELWEATADNEAAELDLVCDIIDRCLADSVDPAEIAVLAPHRFKFADLLPLLEARGIPFVYVGSDGMETCPIVRVVRACLLGLARPEAPLHIENVVEQANRALNRMWIDQATVDCAISAGSRAVPERLFALLRDALGLSSLFEALDQDTVDRLHLLQQMLALANREGEPASGAELASRVLMEWSRLEAAVLRSEQAVKLMTTFNAKGLEYHTVILPFCTRKLVPYIRPAQRDDQKRWHEARRNFYVAMTRSTFRVIFVRVDSEPRSIFLDEIPEGLVLPWFGTREGTPNT